MIYLDFNCFNRPFDDQAQRRVADETEAIFLILQRISDGAYELVWSEILEFENSRHPLADRRAEIAGWRRYGKITVRVDSKVEQLAERLASKGLTPLDAAHVACAEVAGSDFFLTCDDRLLRRVSRAELGVSVRNPVDFLKEMDHG